MPPHNAAPLRRCLVVLILTSSIAGCATAPSSPVCPILPSYGPGFQDRAAAEISALPQGSYARQLVQDYMMVRDGCRALGKV